MKERIVEAYERMVARDRKRSKSRAKSYARLSKMAAKKLSSEPKR